jgi:hypothetical protein
MRCFITNRDCKFEPKEERHEPAQAAGAPDVSLDQLPASSVFMISPFGFPFDDLFHEGVERTINRPGSEVVTRADQSLQLGYVMCQRICRKILDARWVFADLTEPNGNVYYELGLAYGMNRGIVLLSSQRSTNPYRQSFEDHGIPMLTYSDLAQLKSKEAYERHLRLAYRLSKNDRQALEPHAVLEKPPSILNVQAEDCPSLNLHHDAIDRAIKHHNGAIDDYNSHNPEGKPPRHRLEDCHIETLSVGKVPDIREAVGRIAQAKICLFDTTHYEDKPNAIIFFLLGVAHAAEREVIPLTNQPLSRNVPFDIRGLWQVNFEKADQLRSGLEQILPQIDEAFKKDKADYPYRRVWDPFLGHDVSDPSLRHKKIHVITCARKALPSVDRDGRTDIDMWDFTSVSELSVFIAQKYETTEVLIEKPKNKEELGELKRLDMEAFHNALRSDIKGKDCLIIGSPDVSDYAEVVLADLYGVQPHKIRPNAKGLPYQFIKRTQAADSPRRKSAFYRFPGANEKDRVEFGSAVVECEDSQVLQDGKQIRRGETYVVITIAERPDGHHTMVISGFTGVATYAAVQFLTDPAWKPRLEEYLARREGCKPAVQDCTVGVNILVSVKFTQPVSGGPGDRRAPGEIAFKALEFIPKLPSRPDRQSRGQESPARASSTRRTG